VSPVRLDVQTGDRDDVVTLNLQNLANDFTCQANLGEGSDSIWADLGYPVLQVPDGRRFKALFVGEGGDDRMHFGVLGNQNQVGEPPQIDTALEIALDGGPGRNESSVTCTGVYHAALTVTEKG